MRFAPLVAIVALVAPLPAYAHPKLLSATPAASAAVGATNRVQLVFSERLVQKFSTATVVMTSMPGMAMHGPMGMGGSVSLGADGKTLTVTFAKPLPKGTYKVSYRVVSADTHKVEGNYQFQVK